MGTITHIESKVIRADHQASDRITFGALFNTDAFRIESVDFIIDGGAPTNIYNSYDAQLWDDQFFSRTTSLSAGAHTVQYKAYDSDGAELLTSIENFTVLADTSPRISSLNLRAGYQHAVYKDDAANTTDGGLIIYTPANFTSGSTNLPIIFNINGNGTSAGSKRDWRDLGNLYGEGLPKTINEGVDIDAIVVTIMIGSVSYVSDISNDWIKNVVTGVLGVLSPYVDLTKVYMTGFSGGGGLIVKYAHYNPNTIAGLLVVSGDYDVRGNESAADVVSNSNTYVSWYVHENDQQVKDFYATNYKAALDAGNNTAGLHNATILNDTHLAGKTKNHDMTPWVYNTATNPTVFTDLTANVLPAPFVTNVGPAVSASAPTGYTENDAVVLAATASDSDGTVAQVEFFIDDVSVGVDTTSPYIANWTATNGAHTLKVIATDNSGASTEDSAAFSVAELPPNQAPTIVLSTVQANASTGENITFTATASDDVSVTSVEFFVNDVSVGVDVASPYSVSWTATEGVKTIRAEAFDGELTTTTTNQTITVTTPVEGNAPPTVTINAIGSYTAGDSITFTAAAADSDGTVIGVTFLVDNVVVSVPWTSTAGAHTLRAVATDNDGAATEATPVGFTVAALPVGPVEPPTGGKTVAGMATGTPRATAGKSADIVRAALSSGRTINVRAR